MSEGTARRTVRIDDVLWRAAADTAARHNENVSDVIRRALTEYVTQDEARADADPSRS